MKEVWKEVPDFDGYQVSNLGRVWSKRLKRPLRPGDNGTGYLKVDLCQDGIKKTTYVHRIVIVSFRGKSDLHIDHLNGNRKDNRLENLEYVTIRQNQMRAFDGVRSLPLGVHFTPSMKTKPYRALIMADSIRIHLGYFETPELASTAYLTKAKELV